MQWTNHFCKCISRQLYNRKVPHHKSDMVTHNDQLFYKYAMDPSQEFLTLVIQKSWHFMVLAEAHDKLGHQGVMRTYHLIKRQYYWKGMNKDMCKYTANCALCRREKAKTQLYPLQMTDIPECPFDKITIDLITDLNVSTSRNQHILNIINHLMG